MKYSLGLGLVVLTACAVAPSPPPSPPRQTNMDLGIRQFTIANGMRVVLVSDPRATEVQVTMRYQVGAADDPAGQEGIAHLVEHLMYQQVLGAQSLFAKLEDIASYFNGMTTHDATTFIARADVAHLEELLSIEAVRVGFRCTSITDSVFAREREVVVNEVRERDAATELRLAFHKGLFPEGHPYRRAVGGSEASVTAITREQACRFADAHYAPGNAVLVVSGNVTPERLGTALDKFLARVTRRDVPPRAPVPRIPTIARRSVVEGPLGTNTIVIAWPLPDDPALRVKVRAIAVATRATIDSSVRGSAELIALGGERAPMIGVEILPHESEGQLEALTAAQGAIERTPEAFRAFIKPDWLGEVAFAHIQQGAIYNLFAGLEEDSDRDSRFAADVLAGREPTATLGAESQALRSLDRAEAARIATEYLRLDRATIVLLQPHDGTKSGGNVAIGAPVHDIGQRRDPPEPTEARKPQAEALPVRPLPARARTLPNGLHVVLLPVTSVPTVDVRLVFASGTADEPTAKRGVAMAAARALEWNPRHLNDLLLFAAAGGTNDVDVGTDATTFTAHGLDMHLDLLLAGLRRWVRDGRYEGKVVDAFHVLANKNDDDGTLADAWRSALYGATHPYTAAGTIRHVSRTLTVDDLAQFRDTHFTPANATLVIAGRFDAELADRWIDHLFADWTGAAPTPTSQRAAPQPASIAKDDDISQVGVRVALPATAGTRAAQLVAAEMLSQIAMDARHQLGASYGFTAQLAESRLAAHYIVGGWIDAPRASEAVALLRTRLDALRTDPDATARAFVTARRRVITHLLAMAGSAAELAARVEHDVELARPPLSDAQTAVDVNALTIDQMTATLADLDLSRAAILMRGPTADIDRAFSALDRTPVRVPPGDAEDPQKAVASSSPTDDEFSVADIEDALTLHGPATRLTFGVFGGLATGRVIAHDVSGYTVGVHVGYRLRATTSVGLHASYGSLDGSYEDFIVSTEPFSVDVLPLRLGGFIQAIGYDRLWGGAFAGLSFTRVHDRALDGWQTAFGLGLEGGVDVVNLRGNRLDIYGRIDSELGGAASFTAFTLGIGFRR